MNVLIRPIKTEKSLKSGGDSVFTFEVPLSATKNQVKESVERAFDVEVIRVRTVHLAGKTRKFKRIVKKLAARKKAIVALKSGQSISMFESEKKSSKGSGRKKEDKK